LSVDVGDRIVSVGLIEPVVDAADTSGAAPAAPTTDAAPAPAADKETTGEVPPPETPSDS
jgi:hypothetical protein